MAGIDCRSVLAQAGVGEGRLVVAVSGGRDSIVLLDLLRDAAPALDLELIVAHVNHQLRGDASESDERFVRDSAARMGLAFRVRRVDPEAERANQPSRTRPSLEEAARNVRRAALLEVAEESAARWIATAHHAGDQAETVLLRILRGTGPEGLAAMAPRSRDGRWVRPLLDVDPEQVAKHADARGLEWVEDATNRDLRFSRNRIRLEELPRLSRTFNAQLLRTLCNLAETQRRDLEWIEGLVEQAAPGRIEIGDEAIHLSFDDWNELPEALGRRLVRSALRSAGLARDLDRSHIARVLDFLRRGRGVGRDKILELPCGISLRRGESGFELRPVRGGNEIAPSDNATVLGRD